MLLKYYQKTTEFNESLPIESMSLIQIALFAHFVIGLIQLSNYDII